MLIDEKREWISTTTPSYEKYFFKLNMRIFYLVNGFLKEVVSTSHEITFCLISLPLICFGSKKQT